ncbi:MAG: decaprenyl-phosphate phosphoribosyltransferase, partial [Candidatus Woesearchaeota archaeon]|nr:decaprenyl-phosphate phosphoribosyltransferase [Candidatus Woesearchaeota archaeon]
RSVSGTFLIHVSISPWLVLCTFFLSLFLSTAKRQSELSFLGEKAQMHRSSLKKYTPQLTNALIIISTALLIVSYSLYSFLSNYKYLFFTIPIALYVITRYLYLAYSGSEIARHPEKAIKDWKLVLGMFLLVAIDLFIIYENEFAKILFSLLTGVL